ncbi:MAG: protein translocase subunit SecF [Alphaproteobacteria bacterium]
MRKLRIVPDNTALRFMWLRRFAFPASLALVIVSVIGFIFVGPDYGIDFRGGTLIEMRPLEERIDVAFVRSTIGELNLGDVQVQKVTDLVDETDNILVRIELQDGGDAVQEGLVADVRSSFGEAVEFRRVETVGPRVSSELASKGTIALLVTLFAVLGYIWLRFEWQFAVGAVLATIHDVLMTLGFFVVAGLEFNLASIAAMLTIVGYSLNDTVVVYDRIRENLRKYKKMNIPDLLDKSINEMLARTAMTSLTTLLALLALYVFGGTVLRSFIAAMMFGVVIGTYSSIFIAAPILIFFKLRPGQFSQSDDAEKSPQQA